MCICASCIYIYAISKSKLQCSSIKILNTIVVMCKHNNSLEKLWILHVIKLILIHFLILENNQESSQVKLFLSVRQKVATQGIPLLWTDSSKSIACFDKKKCCTFWDSLNYNLIETHCIKEGNQKTNNKYNIFNNRTLLYKTSHFFLFCYIFSSWST